MGESLKRDFLTAQLEYEETIQKRRRTSFIYYMNHLSDWANRVGAELPHHLNREDRPSHLFPILMPDLNSRTRLIEHAKESQVFLTFHYVPLHHSPAGAEFGRITSEFHNTQQISDSLVRLPLFSDMSATDAIRVVEVVSKFHV